MLEAVNTDLVHYQPEAQHLKSSAIHKRPADYLLGGADKASVNR